MKIEDILSALQNEDSVDDYYPSSDITSFNLRHDISEITVNTSAKDIEDIRNDIKSDIDEIETILEALDTDRSELEGMKETLESLDNHLEEFIEEKESEVTIDISFVIHSDYSREEAIAAAISAINDKFKV